MDNEERYILVPQGAIKRHRLWRFLRAVIYFLAFALGMNIAVGPYGYVPSDPAIKAKIWAIVITTLVVTHYLLNFIYRAVAFKWIFKMSYSKENVAYLEQAKTFRDQNL